MDLLANGILTWQERARPRLRPLLFNCWRGRLACARLLTREGKKWGVPGGMRGRDGVTRVPLPPGELAAQARVSSPPCAFPSPSSIRRLRAARGLTAPAHDPRIVRDTFTDQAGEQWGSWKRLKPAAVSGPCSWLLPRRPSHSGQESEGTDGLSRGGRRELAASPRLPSLLFINQDFWPL